MKIQFKRIVSAVCALALCASMMPASALAEPVVSGGDTAIVQQVEEDTSVPVTETTDETTEPVDVADTTETETDTAQPAEDVSESEATEPETSTQPEETEQSSADAEQPAASDVSEPEAAAAVEEQAPVALADGVETYANYASTTVVRGQSTTYVGRGSGYLIHDWEIVAGSGVVSIQGNGNKVTITGKQTGTATLKHTYAVWDYTEYVTVTVIENAGGDRSVYLFVAKPGNTTLSSEGKDYYYLAHGGQVSTNASQSMNPVISTTNEDLITQYVTTWPDTLDFLTGTSSKPVGRDSTWKIDSETGEVTEFTLYLDGIAYSSDSNKSGDGIAYGLRWAKFSWADTASQGSHYHADAILYKKVTVDTVLDELNVKKVLNGFSLNEEGEENVSETFNFKIVDLNETDDSVVGNVQIPLTATVTATGQPGVALDSGTYGDTELAPGHYMLYEELDSKQAPNAQNSAVWETVQPVIFEVYTNGNINVVSGGAKGNTTITNTPKTYNLSYDMNDGTGDIPSQTGLKYNAKVEVSDTVPTKTGSVFLGWSTTADGTVEYSSEDTIQLKGNVTLYAVWGPVSVTKSLVLSNTPVDDGIDKSAYATVIKNGEEYVTYTEDGTAEILYVVRVSAYIGAEVSITEVPKNGTASYVKAFGASTTDNGKTFTMSAATANLYYSVQVSGVQDETFVGNSVNWTIATQSGTSAADDVKVIRTDESLKIEKSILQVVRGQDTIQSVTDDTVLHVGDVVTWQIKVTNTGNVELENVRITDTLHASGTLPTSAKLKIDDGQEQVLPTSWSDGTKGNHSANWTIGTLPYDMEHGQGSYAVITYTYQIVDTDASAPAAKDLSNTAAPVGMVADTGSRLSTWNFVEAPSLTVEKDGTVQVDAGKMQIAYTVTVKNTGNAPFTSVVLKDAKFPASVSVKIDGTTVDSQKVKLSGDTLTVNDTLAIDAVMTVEYIYNVTEQPDSKGSLTVDNTVDVTGTTASNGTAAGTASASTEVYSGTVELALAPIVIYTGGDGNTQAIIGADGQPVDSDETGLPVFGVTMDLPNGDAVEVNANEVAAELYDISNGGEHAGYCWSALPYNDNATVLMLLTPEENTSKVRIQLTDEKNNVITSDEFSIGEALCENYTTELYVDKLEDTTIIAEVDGKYYQIAYQSSTLTVRGTTPDAESNKVVNKESELDTSVDVPQAVMPEDAKYYYVSGNEDNTGVLEVADTSSVSLLVDEIVDQSVETDQQYVQMMKDKVEKDSSILGAVPADTARLWRFYYMDLVLANNGNAVLTTDKDVEIYWPYPDGVTYQDVVDGKYTFTVLHYTGLDRNYESGNFEQELKDCSVEKYTVTPTENGLKFTVPSADGFSPYALVYQYSTKGPDQTVTVEGDDHPDIAEAIANGTWGQPTPTPAPAVIPQTSDDMPLGMLIGVAAVAAAALVVLTVLRRRRRKQ